MKKYIVDVVANNPLCGISTYADSLDLSNGAISRVIKKIVYIGSNDEQWSIRSDQPQSTFFFINLPSAIVGADMAIASHFEKVAIYTTNTAVGFNVLSSGQLRVRPDNVSGMNLSDFKTWLATQNANGTPVTFWYVLATAETDTITVPTGLTGTVYGYLTQTGTPSPSAPIYPTANPVTMWANYTPNIYNSGWTAASGQPEKYNGGWS